MTKLLDCTLRDGGYYNNWDFSNKLVADYLSAMSVLNIDYIEIGFRSLKNQGFKGAYAYSSDAFLNNLRIPKRLQDKIGVMLDGSELTEHENDLECVLEQLFIEAKNSPITLVRIACHTHQFETCLPAAKWLKDKGYQVGFNLMQIADCNEVETLNLAEKASQYPIDVLYFADSMGSLTAEDTVKIIKTFKQGWKGELGIHAHDNMQNALSNSLVAIDEGVSWVDSTVTGMGRGPGNVKTEYIAIELQNRYQKPRNITALLELIRNHFDGLHQLHGWGSNSYYYLAGKYRIHPSYIQEMLSDSRYNDEDILAVIGHLKSEGGKRFNLSTLEAARHFFTGEPTGTWKPADILSGKEVLILGAGPSVKQHRYAIESYIKERAPFVIALNTQKNIDEELIDIRAACHPIRLLADCAEHVNLSQPLATPFHMLPEDVKKELKTKDTLNFGLTIQVDKFVFEPTTCSLPSSLVVAYALAIATSGKAASVYLAGFDGYSADDLRKKEADEVFSLYQHHPDSLSLKSITPTLYDIPSMSVYALTK